MRLIPLLLAVAAHAQVETAESLMAKAAAAYERNLLQEKHWNWTTAESRVVVGRDGRVLDRLPDVVVESVIRSDLRRCVAVLSWGDGVAPYALEADADTRCGDQEQMRSPLRLDSLLRSRRVRMASPSGDAITLAIQANKALLHHSDPDVRCTASVQATVKLDPATWFPLHVEGEIVEPGCEGQTITQLRYGEESRYAAARRLLRKGTSFRLDFALQADKYGHPENSFWIGIAQHWSRPFLDHSGAVIFWNRRFDLDPGISGRRMILETRTTAREFGTDSQMRFDTVPK
jgi:hypothetical protein